MKKLLEALYESEINLSLSWFWDGGYDVKIGDKMNGYVSKFISYDLDECEKLIEERVKKAFPDSVFAKTYNIKEITMPIEPLTFEMISVKSPNVAKLGYDEENSILAIEFLNNTRYLYLDIPKKHFDNLLKTPSIGSYLHRNIKGNFRYVRIR